MINDRKVQIVEVGPRDGLQNEFVQIDDKKHYIILPPETIATYIMMLAKAGLKRIEAGAFVSSKAVPAMAGSEKVAELLNEYKKNSEIPADVEFSYLVPNPKGLERAMAVNANEIAVFLATTDSFSEKNIGKTVEDSFTATKEWLASFNKTPVRGYLSTVFGGAYKPPEEVKPERVVELTKRLLNMGCYEVSLGDTTGIATPEKVEAVIRGIKDAGIDINKIALHFHDTNNLAAENIRKGYELGVRVFDSAVGGVGGCPYAGEGAKGNVATDTAIKALPQDSLKSPIDLELLKEAADYIKHQIDAEKSRIKAEESEKVRQNNLLYKFCDLLRRLLGRG